MNKAVLFLVISFLLGTSIISATHKAAVWGNIVMYKNSSEITITPGSGRCNDNFWETTSDVDLNLSSVLPTGEDFVYIYIDDSASSYPTPTFVGSTTEPTWTSDTTRRGWYSSNDRCIGVVWCNSYGDIVEFQNNSRLEYVVIDDILKQPLENGNPNSAWQTLETTAYIPINATGVFLVCRNSDSNDKVSVSVSAIENTQTSIMSEGYNMEIRANGWIPLQRGWSRDIQWLGYDDDHNYFDVVIYGFRYER